MAATPLRLEVATAPYVGWSFACDARSKQTYSCNCDGASAPSAMPSSWSATRVYFARIFDSKSGNTFEAWVNLPDEPYISKCRALALPDSKND